MKEFRRNVALSCLINTSEVTLPSKMLHKAQFHCSTNLIFSDALNNGFMLRVFFRLKYHIL
jgi:hypothetical protein